MVHINVHGRGMSCLYILTNRIAIDSDRLKSYIGRLMELLSFKYQDDVSIKDWIYILKEESISEEKADDGIRRAFPSIPDRKSSDIRIYSENEGPKMVFIHTANTGSDAYYRLADRIRDDISFAVIEPFNLYHPSEAVYGIKNIAAKYIEILKQYIPQGPYILGGWCYGGIIAHEMACQLQRNQDPVKYLFMLDSHAISNDRLRKESRGMFAGVNREYFETCPLFAELRENGMLEAMINNAAHVSDDLLHFKPSFFHGSVTYFKPDQIPSGASGISYGYWKDMMEYEAGNYENYCSRDKLNIIHTPHEHDLMMDDASLDIIVPEIYKAVFREEK